MPGAKFLILLAIAVPASAQASPACGGRILDPYQARTFLGYACKADCAAEKAGFAWAERHGLTSPSACVATDPALEAGCRAFAAEGMSSIEAGYAWALENEVADPRLCNGGGDGFRLGCRQYVDESSGGEPGRCAEAWPGCAESFPAATPGR
jgi:hypothetical protein